MLAHPSSINSANGIRTRVWALRGPRPSPLDDSAAKTKIPTLAQRDRRSVDRFFTGITQALQESNLQPPVLETGALPIELRTYSGRIPPNVTAKSRCKSIWTADNCELRTTANCGQLRTADTCELRTTANGGQL